MAEILAALQAPADRREIAGWGEALTVYRQMAGRPGTPARPRLRRRRLIAAPLGARLAAAAGAATIAVLGGGVAAAYTGNLPSPLQKFAHEAFAAPTAPGNSASPTAKGSDGPVGPSVTGSAAYGLCNAYQHAKQHGNATQQAVAFRNLVNAAGGAGNVPTFCASVAHPGAANPPGRRVGQAGSTTGAGHHGKPTAPAGKPTATPGNGNGKGSGNGTTNGGGTGNGNGSVKS